MFSETIWRPGWALCLIAYVPGKNPPSPEKGEAFTEMAHPPPRQFLPVQAGNPFTQPPPHGLLAYMQLQHAYRQQLMYNNSLRHSAGTEQLGYFVPGFVQPAYGG